MATKTRPNAPLRDPELKPDVPKYAEKINILEHIRHQFQPIFLNFLGNPDVHGPKAYVGIDMRCPMCKHIQTLGMPGTDHKCKKCGINYKYTAAKGNCFLWVWRDQAKLDLDKP